MKCEHPGLGGSESVVVTTKKVPKVSFPTDPEGLSTFRACVSARLLRTMAHRPPHAPEQGHQKRRKVSAASFFTPRVAGAAHVAVPVVDTPLTGGRPSAC